MFDGGPFHPATKIEMLRPAEGEALMPVSVTYTGLSRRDWFAGQAMVALFAGINGATGSPSDIARASYVLADAMLAESLKGDAS